MPLSHSQVDRAGARTRAQVRQGEAPLDEDLSVIEEFRSRYLSTVVVLQGMLTEFQDRYLRLLPDDVPPELRDLSVASRPKTTTAIVAKLALSSTRLSRMQDIAGGRIVVASLEIQEAVVSGLISGFVSTGGPAPSVKDNRADGDALGYRAIHLVARLSDRPAEIQVRTARQDEWAQTVEDLDRILGTDLKHGTGPDVWLVWLTELSLALRAQDLGVTQALPPRPPQT